MVYFLEYSTVCMGFDIMDSESGSNAMAVSFFSVVTSKVTNLTCDVQVFEEKSIFPYSKYLYFLGKSNFMFM